MKLKRLVVFTLILVMTTSFTVFADDTDPVTNTESTTTEQTEVVTPESGTETDITDENPQEVTEEDKQDVTEEDKQDVTEEDKQDVTEDDSQDVTEEDNTPSIVALNTPVIWDSAAYKEQQNSESTALKVGEKNSYYTVKTTHSGYFYFTITADSNNQSSATVEKRNASNERLADITTALEPGTSKSVMIRLTGKKEYRFAIKKSTIGDKFYAKGYVIVGDKSRTLSETNDANYAIASGDIYSSSSTTAYWKVKVKKKGSMTVSASDISNTTPKAVNITLLNSKKKTISAKTAVTGIDDGDNITFSDVTYGVVAGTYYLKVTTSVPMYGIQYTLDSSYSNKGYTSKKKAYYVKSGTDRKSVLNASRSGQSHYYKFVLKEQGTIPVTIRTTASANTSVKIQLMKSNGAVIGTGVIKGKSPSTLNKIEPTNWKNNKTGEQLVLTKGTYYIRISKVSKTTSAAYEISYTE